MWESLFIALIQGITEFLPVSSSAHLIIGHELLGWAHQALLIDIAAHGGTLLAALVYFRTEMLRCFKGLHPKAQTADKHLFHLTAIASLPVLALGAGLVALGWANELRLLEVIAVANLVFACLLLFADRQPHTKPDLNTMSRGQAALVGLWQAFALIPGASRSGVVLTAMGFLGYTRETAARFALFLAVPSIGAAFLLAATQVRGLEEIALPALTMVCSFGVALALLHGFIRFSQNFTWLGFVVYRFALSALLFVALLG